MTRLNDQVSFRVTSKERRTLNRAARLSERTLSEWARTVVLSAAEIQVQTKGGLYPPLDTQREKAS